MRLLRIEATDFAMYESLDLDLTDHHAVVVVGENGAGKSRLLDAALWSLFGRAAPGGSVDRLIRRGRQSMQVTTTWEKPGFGTVVVERSRSIATKAGASSLHVWVNGHRATKHTIAETQAFIAEVVGLPLRVLLAGSIMVQGESDALMAADPRDRKDVLGRLFGLEEYEAFHEEAKESLAVTRGQLLTLQGEVSRLETLIEQDEADGVEDRYATLYDRLEAKTADRDEARERIDRLRTEAEVLKEKGRRLADLDRLIAGAQDRLDKATGKAREVQARMGTLAPALEGKPIENEAELLVLEEERQAVVTRRAVVAERINALKAALVAAEQNGLCDRCPFRVDTGEWPVLEQEAIVLDNRLGELGNVKARIATARAWLDWQRLGDIVREEVAAADAAGDEVTTLNGERLRLQQEADRMVDLAAELQAATTAYVELENAVRVLGGEVTALEARVATLERNRAVVAERRHAVAAEQQRFDVWTAVAAMFHRDGIPAYVLGQGLGVIEAKANEVLARMPGDLQLTLATERETKAGTTQDTLAVVVDQDGESTDYEVLSGAERFRVDFALRLGSAEVLAHRTGASFETLWLDEPFSAQSPRALDTLLECLAAVADDFGLMVVVTHQPEVADRFPVRAVVTKEDGIGAVELSR